MLFSTSLITLAAAALAVAASPVQKRADRPQFDGPSSCSPQLPEGGVQTNIWGNDFQHVWSLNVGKTGNTYVTSEANPDRWLGWNITQVSKDKYYINAAMAGFDKCASVSGADTTMCTPDDDAYLWYITCNDCFDPFSGGRQDAANDCVFTPVTQPTKCAQAGFGEQLSAQDCAPLDDYLTSNQAFSLGPWIVNSCIGKGRGF
ncbi:uncharacterized protein JCM10292_000979 [Rhodotorula paludigena]|uniref:uncharacterized protein n=1 Tax=Rhodotorula paludigena TaxID=86838 RepID=UPI00317B3A62